MTELSEENKLALIKLKIRHKVEKEIRTVARLFMMLAAVLIMFFGAAVAPPATIDGMIFVLFFVFITVPIGTMAVMVVLIYYLTEKRFKKYLEGEGIDERE